MPKNKSSANLIAQRIAEINFTSVFFISGNRLKAILELIAQNSKNIEIAVCKELTKINELIFRDNVKNIINKIINNKINLKGEFTLIVGSNDNKQKKSINDIVKSQTSKLLKKYTLTETVGIVHKLTNISKKEIYKMTLYLKND